MTTPLQTTLKRAIVIDGREYVITLSQELLKLTQKGKRNGVEITWASLVDGEAALAVALRASVGAFDKQPPNPSPRFAPKVPRKTKPVKAKKQNGRR